MRGHDRLLLPGRRISNEGERAADLIVAFFTTQRPCPLHNEGRAGLGPTVQARRRPGNASAVREETPRPEDKDRSTKPLLLALNRRDGAMLR